jgi:three-Cys-motif partner protein
MTEETFFKEQSIPSEIKAELIKEYFIMWSSVMKNTSKYQKDYKLGYIDLFCGPGVYDDGKLSTPMMIMETILSDLELCAHVITFFNDQDQNTITKLQNNIEKLNNFNQLKHLPRYNVAKVDEDIKELLPNNIPSLMVLDPFGYKGISLELIKETTVSFGCDLILLFNLNSLVRAIDNPTMQQNMRQLFGKYYNNLKSTLADIEEITEEITKYKYEREIIDAFHTALKEEHIPYMMRFRFTKKDSAQALRYLLFVSKSPKGCKQFKSALKRNSNSSLYDCFGYTEEPTSNPLLEYFCDEVEDRLAKELTEKYCKRQHINTADIYNDYLCRSITEKEIKGALKKLEETRVIIVNEFKKNGEKRKKGSFPEGTIINFLEGKNG